MSVIVQKYGGSSVAGVEKLKMVAARVMSTRRQGHDVRAAGDGWPRGGQPEPGLVHQFGGLNALVPLAAQVAGREPTQFLIHVGGERVGPGGVCHDASIMARACPSRGSRRRNSPGATPFHRLKAFENAASAS